MSPKDPSSGPPPSGGDPDWVWLRGVLDSSDPSMTALDGETAARVKAAIGEFRPEEEGDIENVRWIKRIFILRQIYGRLLTALSLNIV